MAYRADLGKPRYDLLSSIALDEWARVMTFGALKYDPNNWRKGMDWSRVIGSMSRHVAAFNAGQTIDPESGLNHMAHVMANAAFLLEYERTHPERDDRYVILPGQLPSDDLSLSSRFIYTFDKQYFDRAKRWMYEHYPHLPFYYCEDKQRLDECCLKHGLILT